MPTTPRTIVLRFIVVMCFVLFLNTAAVYSQGSAFTYQGRLTDGGTPPTATYDLQFKLYDTATVGTGTLQGSPNTVTNPTVQVTNGVFTVQLDFGTTAFPGADRFVEINVRHPGDPTYTTLAPRYQLTATPYSIRTLSATAADSLSTACVACVTDAKINTVAGTKVTGVVANATTAVTAGNVSGTVALANGGTGAVNATNARTNLGLGTLATITPTGTANGTTFLRGDNVWSAPTASNTFFNQISAPASTAANFMALSGGSSTQTNVGAVANVMPGACTFDALFVAGTITSNAASDTLTLTLVKNGVVQALTAQITVSALNTTVTASDTAAGHFFSVAANDAVAIQVVQTNSMPTVRLALTTRCH